MSGRPAPSRASRLCQKTEAPTAAISAARARSPRGRRRVRASPRRAGYRRPARRRRPAWCAARRRPGPPRPAARGRLVEHAGASGAGADVEREDEHVRYYTTQWIWARPRATPFTRQAGDRHGPHHGAEPGGRASGGDHREPVATRRPAGPPVGFLDNTKHNFDRLVAGIGEVLRSATASSASSSSARPTRPPAPPTRSSRSCRRSATSSSPAPRTEAPARRGVSTTRWSWRRRGRPQD